ncbi:MAG: hypothetical protein HGGPFJEG_02565 [Ignavibacteria bacterium]|nr:hypothetical protein [Ignavibacteria bacterium]
MTIMKTIYNKLIVTFTILFISGFSYSQSNTWYRVFSNYEISEFSKAIESSDGNYVAVGDRRTGGIFKVFIAKFNRYGDTIWTRLFNEDLISYYDSYWIDETSDKGFIISGRGSDTAGGSGLLLKIDSSGNYLWHKYFGGSSGRNQCTKELEDKGFIILVNTEYFGPTMDIYIIRTDSLGYPLWSRRYGGDNYAEFSREIIKTGNSGFVIAGTVYPGHENILLMKISPTGDSLWSKTYSEFLSSEGYSVDNTSDGGFIIGGTCDSLDNNKKKSYIIKTDSLGNIQWTRKYTTNFYEWCFSVRSIIGGRYVMCGMSDSLANSYERAIIRVIDQYGNILKEKYYRPLSDQNAFYSVEKSTDRGFILCGFADGGSVKAYIAKTDSNLEIKPVGISSINEVISDFSLYQNYPNPFNPSTVISYQLAVSSFVKLIIYDALGKELATLVNELQPAGQYSIEWIAGKYPSGVYFYTINTPEFTDTRRMMLLK